MRADIVATGRRCNSGSSLDGQARAEFPEARHVRAFSFLGHTSMRLSVNPKDRGYRPWRQLLKRGIRPRVKVNGQEVLMPLTADDRLGYAVAIEMNEVGKPKLNARGNAVLLQQLRGKVEISLEPRS